MYFPATNTIGCYANTINNAKLAGSGIAQAYNNSVSSRRDSCSFLGKAASAYNSQSAAAEKSSAVSDSSSAKNEDKSITEMIREQMEKIDKLCSQKEYDKDKDSKLIAIRCKMNSGVGLSLTEQQYLQIKDPETYSSYQKISTVRKMYRCSLNSCRTKDDVNAMRLSNSLSALKEYKKAIRGGGDGSEIRALNASLERELSDFARSGGYQRLPTTAECNKFDADLAKARKYEREKRIQKMRDPTGKDTKNKKTLGDGKRTVAQVMNSPLGRKVLASRRRSVSCNCGASLKLASKMDLKA